MLSTTAHQLLAKASEKFGPAIFSHLDFRKKAEAVLDKTGKREKRKRALTALVVLTFVVFMSLHRAQGLQNVLKILLNLLREIAPDLPLVAVTPEAICHARKRLSVEPVQMLFYDLAAEIHSVPSFRGLRTWGYDGVRFTIPDTPANVRAFGRPKASRGRAAFPQMLCVALIDTQTHQVRDFSMGRCTASERALARRFTQHLGPGDLLMMDRGCSSAGQFKAFMDRGAHVLGRISAKWNPKKIRQLSDGSWLVRIQGYDDTGAKKARKRRKQSAGQRKTKPKRTRNSSKSHWISLIMRMIEYKVTGHKSCRLITDLLDEEKYPARELAVEYHRRWECELAYDELKVHLATVTHGTLHTVFRSKTPDGVRQEAYGTFIAYNLIRRLMAEAGETHEVPPLEISFIQSVEIIKLAAPRFEGASKRRQSYLIDQLLEDIAATRNNRHRRPQWSPREVKVKMSNYPLKRRRGRGKTINFAALLRVERPPVNGGITQTV